MSTVKTIKLKGKDYVPVDERLRYFNAHNTNGQISTVVTFNERTVYFRAKVTPDIKNPDRFFIGHSFGELGTEKAFEKLETVAVGRALAFMGIGIIGGIASADEIQKFQKKEDNPEHACADCGVIIQDNKVRHYSKDKFGKQLCRQCQANY